MPDQKYFRLLILFIIGALIFASACSSRRKVQQSLTIEQSAVSHVSRDTAVQQLEQVMEQTSSELETTETEHTYIVLDSAGVVIIKPVYRTKSVRNVFDSARQSSIETVANSQSLYQQDTHTHIAARHTEVKKYNANQFAWQFMLGFLVVPVGYLIFVALRKQNPLSRLISLVRSLFISRK